MDQLGLSAFGDRHQNGEYHSHGDAHRLTLRSTKFSANQIVLVLTCSAASRTLFNDLVNSPEQRQRTNHWQRSLRQRRQRPTCRRAAEKRHKFSPSHFTPRVSDRVRPETYHIAALRAMLCITARSCIDALNYLK
jgi:hypothetical protein